MSYLGLSPAALIDGATAIRAGIGGVQVHGDDPGNGGVANKSSAAMVVPLWTTPSGTGNFDLETAAAFTGGTPNGPCKFASLWSDTTGSGIWKGNVQLTGDLTFDSSGNITINSIPIQGSSSS